MWTGKMLVLLLIRMQFDQHGEIFQRGGVAFDVAGGWLLFTSLQRSNARSGWL
jgi:hypothetical protein